MVAGQGIRPGSVPRLCEGDVCPIFRLEAGKPRLVVVFEPKRKLVGAILLKGDEKDPVVALGPTASAKGRLLKADGKPVAGVEIERCAKWIVRRRRRTPS